jgi:two-component system sensor histidine kinase DesK
VTIDADQERSEVTLFPGSKLERRIHRMLGGPDRVYPPTIEAAVVPSIPLSRWGWLYGSVWLFYLLEPLHFTLAQPNLGLRVFGLVALAVFVVWYLAVFSSIRASRWQLWKVRLGRGWGAIGLLIVFGALTIPASGVHGLTTLVYIVSASVMVLPVRHAAILGGTLVALVLVLDAAPGWNTGSSLVFGMIVAGLAVWGVRQMIARNADLHAAHQEIARLAVAEERSRTARDLHDILGHSLTVITVKAELAGRLIQVDPARAEREVNDLERLSREALADIRRTVSGYRQVTLAGELVSARAALDAAGIEAELPTAVDEIPGDRRELFGWVVREGTTNVIRHSGARQCVVSVCSNAVEIADDGRGPSEQPADAKTSSGLRGLSERVEQAGGVLTVGDSNLGGFLLRVSAGGRTR